MAVIGLFAEPAVKCGSEPHFTCYFVSLKQKLYAKTRWGHISQLHKPLVLKRYAS